jgi:thiamine pyrophosphate-dependent acetolactate synthase large subunit-like protein
VTSRDAVRILFSFLRNEPVVHATGYIARLAQDAAPRASNFYMIGSMGMASSIALGIALAKPRRRVVALDGDGAVLMNLGNLAAVGALGCPNFVHVVLDNACYESTGSQPTFTRRVKLEALARSSGYRYARRVSTPAALRREVPRALRAKGPAFLLVRVGRDPGAPAPRIVPAPEEITRSFSASLR